MADNVTLDPGSGGDTVGADDISGVKYQRVKVIIGADGTNDGDVASGNPLPVTPPTPQNNAFANWDAGEYETIAAGQTDQVLGTTGAIGDYIQGILVVPASISPGAIVLTDNETPITVFAGGSGSLSNLSSFLIPLCIKSVSGAWKITTGSNVSCIALGKFT